MKNQLSKIFSFLNFDKYYPLELFNIPVHISKTYLVAILFLILVKFPIGLVPLVFWSMTASLLIHEMGHALVANKYCNNVRIILYPVLAKCEYKSFKKKEYYINENIRKIAFGGPFLEGLFGFCLILIPSSHFQVIGLLMIIDAFYNLLPIMPFDGGKVLSSFNLRSSYNFGLMVLFIPLIVVLINFGFLYITFYVFMDINNLFCLGSEFSQRVSFVANEFFWALN